jgi:hypothetical protein
VDDAQSFFASSCASHAIGDVCFSVVGARSYAHAQMHRDI